MQYQLLCFSAVLCAIILINGAVLMTGNGFKSFQHMPAAPHGPYVISLAASILLEMETNMLCFTSMHLAVDV